MRRRAMKLGGWTALHLLIVCGTLYLCLNLLYKHGFTIDKDGWTMLATLVSTGVVPLLKAIYGKGE